MIVEYECATCDGNFDYLDDGPIALPNDILHKRLDVRDKQIYFLLYTVLFKIF